MVVRLDGVAAALTDFVVLAQDAVRGGHAGHVHALVEQLVAYRCRAVSAKSPVLSGDRTVARSWVDRTRGCGRAAGAAWPMAAGTGWDGGSGRPGPGRWPGTHLRAGACVPPRPSRSRRRSPGLALVDRAVGGEMTRCVGRNGPASVSRLTGAAQSPQSQTTDSALTRQWPAESQRATSPLTISVTIIAVMCRLKVLAASRRRGSAGCDAPAAVHPVQLEPPQPHSPDKGPARLPGLAQPERPPPRRPRRPTTRTRRHPQRKRPPSGSWRSPASIPDRRIRSWREGAEPPMSHLALGAAPPNPFSRPSARAPQAAALTLWSTYEVIGTRSTTPPVDIRRDPRAPNIRRDISPDWAQPSRANSQRGYLEASQSSRSGVGKRIRRSRPPGTARDGQQH